ncbi:MAG: hypothetical protein IPL31_16895 [Saprospiraceae bacterium]|nr:hypothetical protein [Saprospiraceae bacterium]
MKNKVFNFILFCSFFCISNSLTSQVIIYSEPDYRGTSQRVGISREISLPFNVKSIKIPIGVLVLMANEGGCTGICKFWRNEAGAGANLGVRGCTIISRTINAADSRLRVILKTGSDDLRGGSKASMHVNVMNSGTRIHRIVAGNGGLPGNSNRTMEFPIAGVRLDQILDMRLTYESGGASIFDSTDNWNVDELNIYYISSAYPDGVLLFRGSGAPLVRFTGNNKRYTMPVYGATCR